MWRNTCQTVVGAALLCGSCALQPAAPEPATGVTVLAVWPGVTPAKIARELAAPLERELAAIRGVSRTVTRCDSEGCSILLQHDSSVRADEIAFMAGAVIRRLERELPKEARVVVRPYNIYRAPDLAIALVFHAKKLEAEHYRDARGFAAGLMQLPNPVKYEVVGMPTQQTEIVLDPARAREYGISLSDIREAIEKQIIVIDDYTRIIARTPGTKADVGGIVLKKVGQVTVRVRDVATITTTMRPTVVHYVDGEPAIVINLFLRSGATSAEVEACFGRLLKQGRPPPVKRIVPIKMAVGRR